MAYRKTALVRNKMLSKRSSILLATIEVMARVGIEKLTTDEIAKRAGVAAGSIYVHFPDKTELIAAAIAQILDADIAAIRESETHGPGPLDLATAIMVLYGRLESPHLVRAMLDAPMYREAIRDELASLIKRALPLPPKERKTAAAVMLGVMAAVYGTFGQGDEAAAIACGYCLRIIGIPNAAIDRAIDRYSANA